jgi:hypothetical protein
MLTFMPSLMLVLALTYLTKVPARPRDLVQRE